MMGVIPFPDPEPERSTPLEDLFGNLYGGIAGSILATLTNLVPDGMTVGDAIEEVSKVPLRDLLQALLPAPPEAS